MSEKKNLRIETSPEGVTVWLGDKWVIDGSMFLRDGEIEINTEKFGVNIDGQTSRMTLRFNEV